MQALFRLLQRVEALLLAAAMLMIALVTVASVVARNLTGEGLTFAEELNQFLIVLICFVGLSHAAGRGRHIRMSALSDALPTRARRALLACVSMATAALLLGLSGYALAYALGVDRRSPVLDVPLRWVYLLAPFGLAMGAVQYALAAVRNIRGPGAYVSFERADTHEELALEEQLARENET